MTPSQHIAACRVVEADLADILHEAWAAIVPETDPQAAEIVDHDVVAAQVIDAADAQDVAALEAAFRLVQSTYDDQTLGDISDRVLIYTVQKGWSGACKVRALHARARAQRLHCAALRRRTMRESGASACSCASSTTRT